MYALKQKLQSLTQLLRTFDRRLVGIVLIGAVGISVVVSSMRVVTQNYQLLQKIAILEEQNKTIELENRNKEITNKYYESAEFAELKVRRVNGKAAAGERVYILDDETATRALKSSGASEVPQPTDTPTDNRSSIQRNLEAWYDFYFGNN